jgi:long-subunit fatty acid transport protein
MKKFIFTFIYSILGFAVLAGGIVTNTNQSASFIRNPSQDATLGIHAVYYNPAGVTQLKNGFHLSLNNQFISQTRTISTSMNGLNQNTFEGTVKAPLFPSAYAVYKHNKFAISLGFNPIGGGGSAEYMDGLPSFEMQVATLPMQLSQAGIPTNAYSYETNFDGSSVYYGIQGGLTYQVSDVVSLSIGARYVMVDNVYQGYLRNIQINPIFPPLGNTGSMVSAPAFFNSMAGLFGNLAGVAGSLQPLVDGGGAGLTLAQAQAAGFLTAEQVASIAGGFALIDPTINPLLLNIQQIQGAYAMATPAFQQNQQAMQGNAAATADMEVDASQSGTGIVPIIGVNLNFDWLNIGIKYEHKAQIKVKNDTKVDNVGLYPDGREVPSDMPAMLAVGAMAKVSDRINISAGFHTYFDKGAEYGKMLNGEFVGNAKVMDNNFWEFASGAEFWASDRFMLSLGYLFTQTGVSKDYQNDLSHSLSTFSLGGGLLFMVTDNIGINLGAMRTFYSPDTKNFGTYGETYARKASVIAVGLDFSF